MQKAVGRLEMMQQVDSRTVRQQEAAQQLGLSVRQVRRLLIRFREKGAASRGYPIGSSTPRGVGAGPQSLCRLRPHAGC
ncbi:MAG: helix-turn-helix domain-containing protein [Acidithiobacillus sp.]